MKTVFIIWTKYTDILATLVYYLTGRGYTHTAISLEDERDGYYSFCFKGFCRESIEKYRRRGVKQSLQLRLEIPEEIYGDMKKRLDYIEKYAAFYSYTKFGVFCALLHIPFHRNDRYFCSQFVAELLQFAGTTCISRPACLCLPNHLLQDLKVSPYMVEMTADVV